MLLFIKSSELLYDGFKKIAQGCKAAFFGGKQHYKPKKYDQHGTTISWNSDRLDLRYTPPRFIKYLDLVNKRGLARLLNRGSGVSTYFFLARICYACIWII